MTMPKATRATTNQGQYRTNPIPLASTNENTINRSNSQQYYTQIPNNMQSNIGPQMAHMHSQSHSLLSPYATSGNPALMPHYTTPQQPLVSPRPSSGAWSPQDDQTLMQARARGMNWQPIQTQYFPKKTPNACRKRHERLMASKNNTDEWDPLRLEKLGKEYNALRQEIWRPLATATGERWTVVEAKALSLGLKNLQSQARASARRSRHSYPEDSGIEDNFGDSFESPTSDLATYDNTQNPMQNMMNAQMTSAQMNNAVHQQMGAQHYEHAGRGYGVNMGRGQTERGMGIGSLINRGPTGM